MGLYFSFSNLTSEKRPKPPSTEELLFHFKRYFIGVVVVVMLVRMTEERRPLLN
jgi:hypothetical protein